MWRTYGGGAAPVYAERNLMAVQIAGVRKRRFAKTKPSNQTNARTLDLDQSAFDDACRVRRRLVRSLV